MASATFPWCQSKKTRPYHHHAQRWVCAPLPFTLLDPPTAWPRSLLTCSLDASPRRGTSPTVLPRDEDVLNHPFTLLGPPKSWPWPSPYLLPWCQSRKRRWYHHHAQRRVCAPPSFHPVWLSYILAPPPQPPLTCSLDVSPGRGAGTTIMNRDEYVLRLFFILLGPPTSCPTSRNLLPWCQSKMRRRYHHHAQRWVCAPPSFPPVRPPYILVPASPYLLPWYQSKKRRRYHHHAQRWGCAPPFPWPRPLPPHPLPPQIPVSQRSWHRREAGVKNSRVAHLCKLTDPRLCGQQNPDPSE